MFSRDLVVSSVERGQLEHRSTDDNTSVSQKY